MRFEKSRRGYDQASFRYAILAAYKGRCAISRLPEPRLLDAAHSVVDADEPLGQPIVSNELPLSKIHHAAFDANLVGIDPDSERLLDLDDGPSPEQGLKAMAGGLIGLPRPTEDYPDKERLELRFEQLKKIGAVRREEVRPLCCYRVIVHKDGGLA